MKYKIEQVCYSNNDIYVKEINTIQQSSKKEIAIVIHLFYHDIWKEIKSYLDTIKLDFDLYITIPEHSTREESIALFKDYPDITLFKVENRGRDVLPFLQVMRIIGIDTYDYICKLHTKKTAESTLGKVWRKLLYYDLIGSHETVEKIINTFKHNENVGFITGKNTILDSQRYTYGNSRNVQNLAEKANFIYDEYYLFPGGTMFWIRPELISPLIKLFSEGKLDFEEESGQKDDTLAHAIERFFGIIAQVQNKTILESPSSYSQLDDATLDEVASLVLSQQYVGNNVFAMQKLKIEEQTTYISYLEDLAESLRLKNRLKNLFSEKILPLGKKILKIPTKVFHIVNVLKNNPSLFKKVWHYTKNGEIKYLLTKIKEKSNDNLKSTQNLVSIDISKYFTESDDNNYTLNNTTIDIIIPVYNGYEFLEALFNSIEKNTSSSYRLIVINDCSPDERVKPYLLKRLEKHPMAIFIDHEKNQGFLKSVNEAYTHVDNHFVLLNTDTEVPSFWLERLMYPIFHMENIASTTPFTNSGEIASFPHFVADNPIFDSMSTETLDSVFKKVNPNNFYAQVPTGVGFCMGVNYTLTKKIGMFVEDTFGKGYGEENDWCQRAIKEGYKNLIVPNLFVYHKHGGSFSAEEKERLLKENAIKLLDRHPNYGKSVDSYIKSDPHNTLRHLLVLKASNISKPVTLIFNHALGGGADIYIQTYIEELLTHKKNIILVCYDFYSHCYTVTHHYKQYTFEFKIDTYLLLCDFLDALILDEIFINNLVSYKKPLELINYIASRVTNENLKLVVPIHDFYAVCPSYNLLNEKGKYCDIPSLEQCKSCMQSNMQEWRNFYHDEIDIKIWREHWEKLFNISENILCFSNSSKEILLKAYPNISQEKMTVLPHTVKPIEQVMMIQNPEPEKKTLHIGVLGAIDYVKGAHIIKQMVQMIDKDNLDINMVVIGEITETIKSRHFHVTGRYNRDDLPNLVKEHNIDIFLIPTIIPETFSYTTQEIIMMRMPLMVFNLGAPAERVSKYSKGYLIDEISANAVLKTLSKII